MTNPQQDAIDALTREVYCAYGEVTGGVNFQGQPLPAFADLGPTIQHAWAAATRTAYYAGFEAGLRAGQPKPC